MDTRFILRAGRNVAAAGLLFGSLSACCWKCGSFKADHCADFAPGAMPRPVGTYACFWQTEQQELAENDDFVIYEHEWYRGGQQLGPFGQRHVEQIAERLASGPRPVIVQPHRDPERVVESQQLNEARLSTVIETLAAAGIADAGQLVTLARPAAEPLYGGEAVRLGTAREQTGRGVGGMGGAGIGGGGVGSSGFGGGTSGGGFGGGY